MPATYPLDTSGVSPLNRVTNELHTVSEAQFRDYHFLVPNFAPFYVDNFGMSLIVNNVETPLVEDVDFSFALPYVTGTRITGKQMYGSLTLHNLDANGILKITSYQTVGGDKVVDRNLVLTMLAEKAYNPRTTVFDLIANLPTSWPPTPHYQDYSSFYGQEQLVAVLQEIVNAIANNASFTSATIQNFLSDFNSGTSTNYIRKSGDAMLGPLELPGMPGQPEHAVNKAYVDQLISAGQDVASLLANYVTNDVYQSGMDTKLDKSGGIMTGALSVVNPTDNAHAVNLGNLSAAMQTLQAQITAIEEAAGTTDGGYVTKAQFDAAIHEIMGYVSGKVR
ncbi:MAG: hypothetical protein PHN51_10320 [Candidatus Nanopelagicales bacterium]|nr:hypothetical protein [Candidatus Nanopelagicales bacterium]